MTNIKQIFLKFTVSFVWLLVLAGCAPTVQVKNENVTSSERPVDIAIIVPLSGSESALGREYAQMIKTGLADGAKTKIKVSVYDGADQHKLEESAQKILDAGTDIIIGPIYSEPTKIIAQKVKNAGMTVLSLSNNPVLATKQVYVYGHAPMRQFEQLADYLLGQGYRNYILLLPSGYHSTTVSKVLKEMIISKGGMLAGIEFYNTDFSDIEKSVKLTSDRVDIINENTFEIKRPVVILGDDKLAIESILKIAKKFNLDKKAVIAGDSRIDVEESEFVDIVSTGSFHFVDSNMKARAAKAGIKHLSFMHILGYDAGKMLSEYIGMQYNKNKFLEKMDSESFDGISGKIHFIDSIAQRKYEIIKKTNGMYEHL